MRAWGMAPGTLGRVASTVGSALGNIVCGRADWWARERSTVSRGTVTRMAEQTLQIHITNDPTYMENGYTVHLRDGGPCWVIDPGLPP